MSNREFTIGELIGLLIFLPSETKVQVLRNDCWSDCNDYVVLMRGDIRYDGEYLKIGR